MKNLDDFINYMFPSVIVIDFDLNGTGGAHLHLCKGLQADMVIIDEFLTEEDQNESKNTL